MCLLQTIKLRSQSKARLFNAATSHTAFVPCRLPRSLVPTCCSNRFKADKCRTLPMLNPARSNITASQRCRNFLGKAVKTHQERDIILAASQSFLDAPPFVCLDFWSWAAPKFNVWGFCCFFFKLFRFNLKSKQTNQDRIRKTWAPWPN